MKTLVTVLFFAAIVQVSLSIHCYECGGNIDDTKCDKETLGDPVDCTEKSDDKKYNICVKKRLDDGTNIKYERYCGQTTILNPEKNDMCVRGELLDGTKTIQCVCDKDDATEPCNSSSMTYASIATIFTAAIVKLMM